MKEAGDTIGRTFHFEKSLWSKLDDDARRCGRSSVKQLEAILKTYYGLADVELSERSLEVLGRLMPTSRRTLPFIEMGAPEKPKKKKAG